MKKTNLLHILILVLILIMIAGIWIFKNINSDSDEVLPSNNTSDFTLETKSIQLDALTAYGIPIIIDFGSDSCIPCHRMAPVLEAMNKKMQGKAIIKFVDVWKHAEAAEGFPIQVIPTQIFINADGTPYVPSNEISVKFTMYDYDNGDHAFTVHQGGLTEDQMQEILADMGVTE